MFPQTIHHATQKLNSHPAVARSQMAREHIVCPTVYAFPTSKSLVDHARIRLGKVRIVHRSAKAVRRIRQSMLHKYTPISSLSSYTSYMCSDAISEERLADKVLQTILKAGGAWYLVLTQTSKTCGHAQTVPSPTSHSIPNLLLVKRKDQF